MVTRLNFYHEDLYKEPYWTEVQKKYGTRFHHAEKFVNTRWDITKLLRETARKGITLSWITSFSRQGKITSATLKLHATGKRDCYARFDGKISSYLTCADREDLSWWAEILFRDAPPVKQPPVDNSKIDVTFTFNTPMGNTAHRRRIAAPRWEEIISNYPSELAAQLSGWLEKYPSPAKLVGNIGVFYGPPGTGKTSFLRALGQHWRETTALTYVTDTEQFFNNPAYMMDIMMGNRGEWNVIFCEDAEEFLSTKKEVGQALSRILNVGDGMLGQGLQVKIIFTSNTREVSLNPAITRPGRCFFRQEFPLFPAEQANRWLADRGVSPVDGFNGGISLGDMYALTRKDDS